MAITEAKILGKPIVASNIPVFSEQIRNGENGIVVPLSPETICTGIQQIVDNPQLMQKVCNELRKETIGNEKEVNKLYELLDGAK